MRIGTNRGEVTAVGGKQSKFKIKASGKAFRALQDSLYSNKYESIVRELWSNAYDAHRVVGRLDIPFWVQLPNRLDLHFKVRDFGPGLSLDDIENVYTVYFESTKDQSDDDVGGFGLGAKTPYSYVDTFNVVSYQKGKKYIYNAFIDENDEPNMILMGEQQTSEPDGLEVSFPVKPEDVSSFENAAKWYYKGFKIKPLYYGHGVANATPEEYALSGSKIPWDEWEIEETIGDFDKFPNSPYANRVYALLGCVPYSINPTHFKEEHYQFLTKMNGVLHFKVGELAPTLSRESLSYGANEPTIQSIRDKISETLKLMAKTYQEKFDKAKSPFEKYVVTNLIPSMVLPYVKGSNNYLKGSYGNRNNIWFSQTWGEVYYGAPLRKRGRWNRNYTIEPRKTTVYIEQEVKTKDEKKDVRAKKRIEAAHTEGQLLWFKHQGTKESSRELIELMAFFGDDPDYVEYKLVSDLPDDGPASRAKSKPVAIKAYIRGNYHQSEVNIGEDDFDKGGYYIKYNKGYCRDHIETRFRDRAELLQKAGILDTGMLYCVPKTYWGKFEKADQWIHAEPLWQDWCNKDLYDKKAFAENSRVEKHYPKVLLKLKGDVVDGLNQYYTKTQEVRWGLTPQEIASLIGTSYHWQIPAELEQKLERLKQRYPMLKIQGWETLDIKTLQDYIDLVGSQMMKDVA